MKGIISFKVRIDSMRDDRWAKKVHGHVDVMSKWLRICKRTVSKCGLKCNSTNPGRGVSMCQLENAVNGGAF